MDKLKAQIAKNKENQTEEKQEQTISIKIDEKQEEVSFEKFKSCFETYLQQLDANAKSRLTAFLRESPLDWKAPCTAIIELKSEMELEMISEERIDFMPWFRSQLKNNQFEIEFTVNKNRIVNLSRVSKGDQLKIMIEKQPILAEYVQHLGLEIDY